MKQYSVISCAVEQMEDKLNDFAKEGWDVIDIARLTNESMAVVLEKSVRSVESVEDISQLTQLQLQDLHQQQTQLMQMMSNIIKSQHDVAKSIIQNLR